MINSSSNWQDALNHNLVNRLSRPLRQPGMMKMAMSQRIINRCDRFLNRLPLLNQQMQRWGNTNTLSSEPVPIVYAQPISLAGEQKLENKIHDSQPIVSQVQPTATIIQRKLDTSQSLPTKTVSHTHIPNSTNLSNSDLAAERIQPLNLETPSEIPIVSPQANSAKFPQTAEIGLAPLIESSISSPSRTELNLNHQSQPILNATSISSSEFPVVSPLANSEELPKTVEMRITPLSELPISSSNTTELNRNYPSDDLYSPSTSDSKNPVVAPQPILPIIQAKLQNYSQSDSSLPITNNLNISVEKQPRQPNNYAENFISQNPSPELPIVPAQSLKSQTNLTNVENFNLSKYENFLSQTYSEELPIVTAQSLKFQNHLTNNAVTNAISQISQNQNPTFINTQPVNISQINQTNNKQNISSLPLLSITSPSNPSQKPQSSPLPLAKATPSSKSNNQQPNLSNRNSNSNTDSSSNPRTFTSSSSPTETSVSPLATRNVDIDVNAIASQVERKLMRKLVIESERRGKNR
ncbi:hypothetical protein H6G76_18220 [Nostoc sp. FACHB-152]|uniref:hypothetical protein n=1 Tax=unclassified Nostoc TaxID=2593658 RepID=UPI001688F664|nr:MULTISPECIES: hypothetical protein [unclassified Nostoc]MBD2449055.1 hypothetical protein [Nostoc sp. FACHB-152]MBD2471041.1 hypothetical protein [Nostoc sp. FACHB-145]